MQFLYRLRCSNLSVWFSLWTFSFLIAYPAQAGAGLPLFPGLEADVAFWESVFSKYKPHHCIFHDRDDLSVIYGVAKLPEVSPDAQSRTAQRYLKVLRHSLAWLGDGGDPRNRLERMILQVTPMQRRTSTHFRVAQDRIRCQRGVDLTGSMQRSRPYLQMIKRILRQEGLPPDLAHLPHLESGYTSNARSTVGAVGLWQFMPATARQFGLHVSWRYDARLVPKASTQAAARYLRELYSKTGSWPLAITAYNYGPNGVMRAIKLYGRDYMNIRANHKTKLFGFASRNYYPSFLAVRNLAERS